MTSLFRAAAAALAVAGIAAAPAFAQGPKASSENTIPAEPAVQAPAPSGALLGPRASSSNYIPPQTAMTGTPHYEWVMGYENGGKWRGHWELVR
jgi:hypothetical protein